MNGLNWNFRKPLEKLKTYKRGKRPIHRRQFGASIIELEKSLLKIKAKSKK